MEMDKNEPDLGDRAKYTYFTTREYPLVENEPLAPVCKGL
jgi:hypothetical protein